MSNPKIANSVGNSRLPFKASLIADTKTGFTDSLYFFFDYKLLLFS